MARDLNTAIRLDLQGARRVETALGRLRQRFARLGRSVRGLTGLGFLGGAYLTLRKLISATIEQEQAEVQLAARLKNTGGAAGFTAQELTRYASALQEVTTFGDEAIIQAQALLATFTKIRGEAFQRTTEAALDMATIMGTDLKSAVIQLGKALNEPRQGLEALSRAGVTFEPEQRKMIRGLVEAGDLFRAQKIILDEVETQIGNAARAMRNTFGGALQSMGNALSDLLEGNGPSLKAARESVEDLITLFKDPDFRDAMEYLVSSALSLARYAALAAGGFGRLIQEIQEYWSSQSTTNIAYRLQGIADRISHIQAARRRLEVRLGTATEGSPAAQQLRNRIAEQQAEIGRLRAEGKALQDILFSRQREYRDAEKPKPPKPGKDPGTGEGGILSLAERQAKVDRAIAGVAESRNEAERDYLDTIGKRAAAIRLENQLTARGGELAEVMRRAAAQGLRARLQAGERFGELIARVSPAEAALLKAIREDVIREVLRDKAEAERRYADTLTHSTAAAAYQLQIAQRTVYERELLNQAESAGVRTRIAAHQSLSAWLASLTDEERARVEVIREGLDARREELEMLARAEALRRSDSPFDGIREGLRRLTQDTRSAAEEWADVTTEAAQRMSASLTEFVRTGKLNFGSLVDYIIQESIRLTVVDPLIKGLAGAAASLFGGGASGLAKATFDPGAFGPAATFHRGGVVPGRGDVPILAQGGEVVLTRDQARALGGAMQPQPQPVQPQRVEVRMVNQGAPKRAEVSQTQMDGRTLVLAVLLEDLDQRGDYSSALERTMGLRRVAS